MSAFLGPIHFWLYNKIKLQNELVENIIKNFDMVLPKDLDSKYPKLESGELSEIIDGANIHGWLQERISRLEFRLAYVVKTLTDLDAANIARVEKIAYELGREYRAQDVNNADEAYRLLENILLNGMPCDRVNAIVEEGKNSIIWEQTIDIHKKYWDEFEADIRAYYAIRSSIVEGVLSETDFIYLTIDTDKFEIRRK